MCPLTFGHYNNHLQLKTCINRLHEARSDHSMSKFLLVRVSVVAEVNFPPNSVSICNLGR